MRPWSYFYSFRPNYGYLIQEWGPYFCEISAKMSGSLFHILKVQNNADLKDVLRRSKSFETFYHIKCMLSSKNINFVDNY